MSKFSYYIKSSTRRKALDKLLNKHASLYKGVVLDIGGRDRGIFQKPKTKVEKWIFADIEKKHKPDMILDVANMEDIEPESVDVVNAIELFEHVFKINEGISECYRVLKKNGLLILTVPFLFPVHADPFDYQRWTNTKWIKELNNTGFKIEKLEITGRFFSVLNGMLRNFVLSLPVILRHLGYLLFPVFDLFIILDKKSLIKNHPKLGNFHDGYFIIARK